MNSHPEFGDSKTVTRLTLVALALAPAFVACADAGGSLTGAYLEVPDCKHRGESTRFEPFELSLESVGVQQAGNVATIRMLSRDGQMDEVDQVALVLYDIAALKEGLAAHGEVEIQLVAGQEEDDTFTIASADTGLMTLVLFARCGGPTTASMAGVGTLVMTEYGHKDGATVAGRLAVDVIDRRSGATLGEDLTGEFSFEVDTSSPATAFAPKDY